MTNNDQEKLQQRDVKKELKYTRPIQKLFLLDVLSDKGSRPAFLWALSALALGTVVYHWLEGWSSLSRLPLFLRHQPGDRGIRRSDAHDAGDEDFHHCLYR